MQNKWSVKKAVIWGLIIGIIGVSADLAREGPPTGPMHLFMLAIQAATPAALFAAIAGVQHLFVRKSKD